MAEGDGAVADAPVTEAEGAFIASLKRSNKAIRADRAEAISEDAELIFKRTVEDLDVELKRLKRQRENMLDMSPDNAHSLIVAENFDSRAFVEKDIDLGVQLRNTEIKLDIAQKRYQYLFGGE